MTAERTRSNEISLELLRRIVLATEDAGQAILQIYNTPNFEVAFKEDQSPLTEADLASNKIITDFLKQNTPNIPILSEESKSVPYEKRRNWKNFWLIDPLDGTKEFVKRNGEFTVNVALIENGGPVLGVVHAPVRGETYWADGFNSFKSTLAGISQRIMVARSLETGSRLKVVASRSHGSEEQDRYLATLPEHELVSIGSSLKFCLVAEGKAHIYPRLGPTMEWDTAAAHAVVLGAGGTVRDLEGKNLLYNKRDLHNPYFIVSGLI